MSLRTLNLNKFLTTNTLRTTPRFFTTTSTAMATNSYGQGESHATGGSKVPGSVQEQVPKGVETSLPNAVHDTGDKDWKTHAKNDGEDSIVPKKIQEAVPESVERALPDSIHNTGDSKK